MKERIKKNIGKYDNLIILFILLIAITGWNLRIPINYYDETWNLFNITKMINGYKLYKDANVIITPLFFVIGFAILKIIGTNLLVFKIYNIFIITALYFFVYLIIKKLIKAKSLSILFLFVIYTLTRKIITPGANYNALALVFVLIGLYFNLIWQEKSKKHNIWQGIIMLAVLLTKQNIGAFYIISIIIYQYLLDKKSVKDMLKQIGIVFIGIGVLAIILIHYDVLYNFIDLTILGMREFTHKNIYTLFYEPFELVILILIVLEGLIFLIKTEKFEDENQRKNSILLGCTSIAMAFIRYPIFNFYHIAISNIVVYIFIIYISNIFILKKYLTKNRKIIKMVICFLIFINLGNAIYYCNYWIKNKDNNQKWEDVYFGGFFETDKEKEEFARIEGYLIEEQKKGKVIIFSARAPMYYLPFKINNGYMDLPNIGNFGKDGEESIIEQIKNIKHVKILVITDEEKLFPQESKMINNYIKDNFKFAGEIEEFSIYEK